MNNVLSILSLDAKDHLTLRLVDRQGFIFKHCCPLGWNTLKTFTENTRIVLLIPGDIVVTHRLSFPEMQKKDFFRALPYALEECLVESIELIHFAYTSCDSFGFCSVAVISKTSLSNLSDLFEKYILSVNVLLPVYLALRWRPHCWTIFIDSHLVYVRLGDSLGFVVEKLNWKSILSGLLKEYSTSLPDTFLFASDDHQTSVESLRLLIGDQVIEECSVVDIWDYAQFLQPGELNLLQGKYKSLGTKQKNKLAWRWVGWLSLGFILTLYGGQFAHWMLLKKQTRYEEARIEVTAKKLFPKSYHQSSLQHLLVELKQHWGRVGKHRDFIILLHALDQVVRNSSQRVTLSSFSYTNDTLAFTLSFLSQTQLKAFISDLQRGSLQITQNRVTAISQHKIIGSFSIKRPM